MLHHRHLDRVDDRRDDDGDKVRGPCRDRREPHQRDCHPRTHLRAQDVAAEEVREEDLGGQTIAGLVILR